MNVETVAYGAGMPPRHGCEGGLNEEAHLVRQVIAGRKDVFVDLLKPHLSALYRLVRTRMRNDFESDDVIQLAVLKAFTHLGQFRFESSFSTWLTRIALNEVSQWRRKRLSTQLLILKYCPRIRPELTDEGPSPHYQCERREAAWMLRKALARLPKKYQVMIHLRDLQDLSIAEVSRLLNLSVPATKSRHRRARQELVSIMQRNTKSGAGS